MLQQGNKKIKNQVVEVTQTCPVDYSTLHKHHQVEHLLSVFKSKEYMNRNLLSLEKCFEVQRHSSLSLQQRVISQEQELIRVSDKLQGLQQETIGAYNRCEQQLTQLHQMQQQLAGSVPRDDLDRQTHMCEQMQNELYEARDQGRQLRERLER